MTASQFEESGQSEPSRAAVLAKADDTGLSKVSEVKVFAIPLFHQGDLVQLVYLPVPAKESAGEPGKSYVPQKLRDYATKTQVRQAEDAGNDRVLTALSATCMKKGQARMSKGLCYVPDQVQRHVAAVGSETKGCQAQSTRPGPASGRERQP